MELTAVTTKGIYAINVHPEITMDKAFIFVISEWMTNTIMFIGKVEKPLY